MRAKSMHSAWHANPAECFAPRNRVGLSARLHGQSIWWRATATNDLVDLFLNVDERLLHSAPTLSEPAWPGKLSPLTRPADERPPESAPVTVPGRELGTRSSQSTVVYLRRNEAGLFADTSKVRSIFSVNGSLTEGEG